MNAEALRPPLTGIGNYTYHLLAQLHAKSEIEGIQCFTGTHWHSAKTQLEITASHKAAVAGSRQSTSGFESKLRAVVGAIPGTKAAYDTLMNRRFERTANTIPNAIYHETNYILKPYSGPSVTTVHDLSHLHYPQFHPKEVVDYLNLRLPETLKRADKVITVSDVVRDELLDAYDLAPEHVHTIYEGVEAAYIPRTAAQTHDVLAEYGLEHDHYVLHVATLEPRKGISVLLDAWELLPKALRLAYPLVMTGSSGWRNSDLVERISRLQEEGSVRHLGYVPSEALPSLYAGASVFSYPSVYEGFGLPVLDAMSSGVPVICRAQTSMSEFAQGACLLCDSAEPEELADKLSTLLMDSELRVRWGQKGRERSQFFSWQKCADETLAVYAALL